MHNGDGRFVSQIKGNWHTATQLFPIDATVHVQQLSERAMHHNVRISIRLGSLTTRSTWFLAL